MTADLIAAGRSNLTYRLSDGVSRWVLRTPPRTGRTPTAHDVVREHRITRALHGTAVPVPRPVAACEDETVLGVPFAVWELVPGATLQTSGDLDTVDDTAVGRIVDELVTVLAALHAVDPEAIGLGGLARTGGYAERQLRRWSGQWELVGPPQWHTLAGEVTAGLREHLPQQVRTGVVHGDYRVDNTLVDLSRCRISAVVDWELATLGDPTADLAMMCAYRDPAFDLIVGEPAAWTSTRLPPPDALAESYEAVAGVELHGWAQHLALAAFKIAVIAAGIAHRARTGAASGPGFATAAQAVGPYLHKARDHLRGRQ
ncbi:phosphotransferase family protein [Xylanimonas allomyrinae]|uniref:Phosphotransferase family protein n=2 Tax=Xylanimonas allomyrinae TaxID=2509459 RepID=A0A4P6EPI3_9MICO|nr:phosphotransferase family protein [Xylanimonas allomyrinae]